MWESGPPPSSMSKRDRGLTDCGQCVKYLLITGNVIIWLLSCAVIGIGVWILVDKNFMQAVYGNVLMTVAAYLIVVAGGAIFLITGCGCIGAIAQNRTLLLIYFITLCGIAVFLIVGVILAIVYRTEGEEEYRDAQRTIKQEVQYSVMRETLQKSYGVDLDNYYNDMVTRAWDRAQTEINYEVEPHMRVTLERDYGVNLHETYNRMVTDSWDMCQEHLRCCGVEDSSWNVYQVSEWYKIQTGEEYYTKPLVPLSCCKRNQYKEYINKEKCQTWYLGPPGIQAGVLNEALHYRGCYEAGKEFINDFTAVLIGMGVGVAAFIICGILLSFMLFRMVDY